MMTYTQNITSIRKALNIIESIEKEEHINSSCLRA
jgi:hypothetical protein